MSFARLPYDEDTYKQALYQSIGPGEYYAATPLNSCGQCFVPSPSVRIDRSGAAVCEAASLVDVDSELIGITRRKTKCPAGQYLPGDAKYVPCEPRKLAKDCNVLDAEDTRLSNPPCTLRGRGWNRWEWLCKNPQDTALMPFDYNVANRIVVKDNHRPCVPTPMDQSAAFPPETDADPSYKVPADAPLFPQFPSIVWRACGDVASY
jgi:hypothetical protein